MCESLIVSDPWKRLGSGPEGSSLSFTALKQHQFFQGKDFESIIETDPPIDPEVVKMMKEIRSKAMREFESVPEPILFSNTEDRKSIVQSAIPMMEKKVEEEKKEEAKVLREGVVDKKCGWLFFHNRKLILTSQPRLSYYQPVNNEYKVSGLTNI